GCDRRDRLRGESADGEYRRPAALHGHGKAPGGDLVHGARPGGQGVGDRRGVRPDAAGGRPAGRGPLAVHSLTSLMNASNRRAEVLIEALPYIRAFQGKTLVIKYGGAANEDARIQEQLAKEVPLLALVGIRPLLQH